jgi:hypothetical protein
VHSLLCLVSEGDLLILGDMNVFCFDSRVPTVSHGMAVADSKTAERREKCMVLLEVV